MIKKIRYKITNCFFVEGVDNKVLAVDVGWPNTLYDYAREMKSINLKFGQISWAIVTHFHMDHAGLFGEMINEGIKGIVLNNQEETINEMEHLIEKHKPIYTKIRTLMQLPPSEFIENYTGVSVDIISVGYQRSETMIRKDIWTK